MAQRKLILNRVTILVFDRKSAGGKARLSCSPSRALEKVMGWEEMPDWQKSATPQGPKLAASLIEFTPHQGDLRKHAFDLQVTAVDNFEFVRVQMNKGKTAKKSPSFRLELHCSVHFSDPQGATKLERYMGQVLESTVRITYEESAEQEELLSSEEQRQAVSEATD